MNITKILPAEATPAKAILDRAQHVALTSAQRAQLPDTLTVGSETLNVTIAERRPVEVGEVLIDEAGHFYVVDAAPEDVLVIKGDEDFVSEAAVALLNRGIRVAQTENGFAVVHDPALIKLFSMIGLEFEHVQMPFIPVRMPKAGHAGGCCCGGHNHHEHGEGCGCGGHHHHHEHGEECGCGGHHHHEHGEGCGCGSHHHHHEHGEECGCGGHRHHEHGEGCGCGEHHHHHEHGEDCGCGGHHHHHHHHEAGECCCKTEKSE